MKYLKSKKLRVVIFVILVSLASIWIYEEKQTQSLDESKELSRVLDSLGLLDLKNSKNSSENMDSAQLDSVEKFYNDSVYRAYKDSVAKMNNEIDNFLVALQRNEYKGVVKSLSVWQPAKVPLVFRGAKGLNGFVTYRVFYQDSTKINELKKWESSLGVSMGNIFYLSERNQWNLPHLTGLMRTKFNEILPEKWISSVEIIHIELSPVENDNKNTE